jgi:hypothetical protein
MSHRDRVTFPVLSAKAAARSGRPVTARDDPSRSHFEANNRLPVGHHEEALVADERWHVRPAQVVESKLARMLKDASLPVSHLQMRSLLRNR